MKTTKLTQEEFIRRAKEIHGDKFDYSLVEYKNIFSNVNLICKVHGEFSKQPNSLLLGTGCQKCYNEKRKNNDDGSYSKLSLDTFINRSNFIHENKYDYSLVEYKNVATKVKIVCPKHGLFEQTPGKHFKGQGCRECGKIKNSIKQQQKTKEEFVERSKFIHNNRYDYSLVDYKGTQVKIKIICPEHGIWEQKAGGHLSGKGCRTCSGSKKLTMKDFLRRATDVHENKYDYSLVNYTNHYGKVDIICPIHGEFKQGAGSHLSGVGCPNCNESKGEREIRKWLINKKINFSKQKTFNNCKFKRQLYFDFYLPDYNMCIEFDGKQHFYAIEHFGGEEKLLENKKRDEFKSNFCIKNNIRLERIRYDENIIERLRKIEKSF